MSITNFLNPFSHKLNSQNMIFFHKFIYNNNSNYEPENY